MNNPPKPPRTSKAGNVLCASPVLSFCGSPAVAGSLERSTNVNINSGGRAGSAANFSFGHSKDEGFSFGGKRLSLRKRPLDSPVCQPESRVCSQLTPVLFISSGCRGSSERQAADLPAPGQTSFDALVTDLDLTNLAAPEEAQDNGCNIEARLLGFTDAEKQHVKRLVASPDILSVTDAVLSSLEQFSSLGFLILSMPEFQMDMFARVADHWPSLGRLTSRLKNIVCLDVSNCMMQDHHLQAIARDCQCLRALDVSYNPCLTSRGLSNLLLSCPSLEELDISTCPRSLTDPTCAAIGSHCHGLTSLYMELDEVWMDTEAAKGLGAVMEEDEQCLSQQGLQHIAAGCAHLQVLSLAGQHIAAAQESTVTQPLEPSAISSSQQPSSTVPGAQAGLARLLHTCSLSSLNLQSCDWVDCSVVSSLCSSSHMQGLQRLQLHGGPCLGDNEAAQLAANCTALVSLQLQQCYALTATGICSIVRCLLLVIGCLSYTACLMPAVLQHCPQLVELDVCGCPLVLEELVQQEVAQHTHLTTLTFTLPDTPGQQGSLLQEDEEPPGSCDASAAYTLSHAVVSSHSQQPQPTTNPSQTEQPMAVPLAIEHAPLVALDMNEKAALRAAAVMPSPIYKPKAVVAGGGQKGTPSLFTFKEEENKEPEPAQKPAWGALLSFLNHQSGAVPS